MRQTAFKIILAMGICTFLLLESCGVSFALPAPQDLAAPALARTDRSIWLYWSRPQQADVSYYEIYVDGKYLASTKDNLSAGAERLLLFQKQNSFFPSGQTIVRNYCITGLEAGQSYEFAVCAVDQAGQRSAFARISAKTKAKGTTINVAAYGADGTGQTDVTQSLQAAIDACPAGGTVFLPAGKYLSGALHLHSDMTLALAKGAILQGSARAAAYPLAAGGYAALLSANGQKRPIENLAIIGAGVIAGSGWQQDSQGVYCKADNRTKNGSYTAKSVFGIGELAAAETTAAMRNGDNFAAAYSKRSNLIELHRINDFYLAGVTLRNPAKHALVLTGAKQAIVNGVQFMTYDGNNGDGIDFQGQNLIVANSYFDTGDDCLDLAAGTGAKAKKMQPTQAVQVFNNFFAHGHGAVSLGSHTGAWIRDICISDNVMQKTQIGLRVKTGNGAGGGVENVAFVHNSLQDIKKYAFSWNVFYPVSKQGACGQLRNFVIDSCSVEGVEKAGIFVRGSKAAPVEQLFFTNLTLRRAAWPSLQNLQQSVFQNVNYNGTPYLPKKSMINR